MDVLLFVGIPSWCAAIGWNTKFMCCYWLEYRVDVLLLIGIPS